MLFVPLKIDGMTFFSTVATFGHPLDVTLAELSIESFFPAVSGAELRGSVIVRQRNPLVPTVDHFRPLSDELFKCKEVSEAEALLRNCTGDIPESNKATVRTGVDVDGDIDGL